MASKPKHQSEPRQTGGQAGMRGYLVQTLIALLDGLLAENAFVRLTLEPDHASEKFDLLWENAQGNCAVQVKSSANQFAEADVRRWAAEMETSAQADEYHLCLVGLHSTAVAKLKRVGKVILETKNLDIPAFREQAAHRLDRFFHAEKLDSGTAEQREMLADALTARLAAYSTTGQPLNRTDLVKLLRTWVNEAPKEGLQIATSRLFRGKNTGSELLIGRDGELKALDTAWSGAGKKNIVTIVAWGGIGKTSLAVHWKNKLLALPGHGDIERYFDWSFYSQGTRREGDATGASHAASADLFLKEALEFFGDPALAASNAGAWQKGERLAQLIGNRRCLLILDGLEPLQDAGTGELRDDGLRALLRGLAAHNHGLCLVTTRQHLPELATWHQTTAPEWELACLTDEAGAALLTKLGVNGTDPEKRDLSASVRGHALTLTLLGRYLKRAHHGDIRRVDRVDFQKVNEKEQGGHAFRVIAAYERWFEENNRYAELAILRMLGLFDRPATPDCLAALRNPPIAGLTDAFASLKEEDWNEAVTHLVELNLVEEQPWEPCRIVGYSEEIARKATEAGRQNLAFPLGEPKPFPNHQLSIVNHKSLDTHPLIREFFGKRLQETAAPAWKTAHYRLFEHLRNSVPYWPDGLDGLQPLYQTIAHGCQAGRYQESCDDVYRGRVLRGDHRFVAFYSIKKLGALGIDLAALGCFFVQRWTQPASELNETTQGWLIHESAARLQALGRLTEAREAVLISLDAALKQNAWGRAAHSANNLSELDLALGDVPAAVRDAKQSVEFADRYGVAFEKMCRRTTHANALHQAGLEAESKRLFEMAESMQGTSQPYYLLLYSARGFHFCDLLLAGAEQNAWRIVLSLNPESSTVNALVASCRSVEKRATQTLEWSRQHGSIIEIAFDHLALSRALFYRTILENSSYATCHKLLEEAIHGFRHSSQLDYLPLSLLTRAWLRVVQGQPNLARADLDEAQQIAERGPMRLHMVDIHLHCARLFRDKEELRKARALIEQCGYWRRKKELEDAESAAINWPEK